MTKQPGAPRPARILCEMGPIRVPKLSAQFVEEHRIYGATKGGERTEVCTLAPATQAAARP